MATITSSGIGSGLDVEGIISKLMAIERQPLTQLQTKEASYQAKLTAFGTLKSAFASLQTAARALKSTTLFTGMTATASDTSVLTASANSAATAATYGLEVVKLAKGQTIASGSFTSLTADNISIGQPAGKLKIELGEIATTDDNGDPVDAYFKRDAAKAAVTIDIPQDASSLSEIRDAINTAKAGVTARIVDVGGGNYKLMVSADGTGAKTNLKITAVDADGNAVAAPDSPATNLTQFNYDAATDVAGGFDQTVGAQDAHLRVNSLDIYRSTNTVSDAITGVTLALAKEGTSNLTIARNTGAVAAALDTFVKAYNAATKQVRDLSTYNATTQQAALLTGDAGVRSLQNSLRDIVRMSVPTESSAVRSLSDLGITLQRDGQLQFNATTLDTALRNNPEAVAQFVTSGNGDNKSFGVSVSTMLDGIMRESSGVLASRTEGIDRSIKDIDKRRATLVRRLGDIEQRYRKQFSSLDSMLASMQSTSQYLQQQLSALSNNKS